MQHSLEAKNQLNSLGKYPDIVVGSCGGGANLLGIATAFIADRLNDERKVEIFSAESELCPILTQGKIGWYSVDTKSYFPLLETYGLDGLLGQEYIGGLGSTIVASAVAQLRLQGVIQAKTFSLEKAKTAAQLFYETERKVVALETGYQLAGVIEQARRNRNKVILASISSGDNAIHLSVD